MPLPGKSGFQYFELCALTLVDSPAILWLLSDVGSTMLGALSPLFYGDDAARQRVIETVGETGSSAEPKPFLPYESIQLGEDGERLLFVPRFRFYVPQGPPVEVVEPLPISVDDWRLIGPMSLSERGVWASSLGPQSARQWQRVVDLAKTQAI